MGGDAGQRPAVRERETLHRRDANSEPGERAGADSDRVQSDVGQRHITGGEQIEEVAGKPSPVRDVGDADVRPDERAVTPQRHAAGSRARVEGESDHVRPL